MRRLIADRRRNCAIISLLSLFAIAVAAVIVKAKLVALNEQWRNDALALCSDLQANSSWLKIETEVVQDYENLSMKLAHFPEAASLGRDYSSEKVDFIVKTRKKDCQTAANELAGKCLHAINELEKLRKMFENIKLDGDALSEKLGALLVSPEASQIKEQIRVVQQNCETLQRIGGKKVVLSWKTRNDMTLCRALNAYLVSNSADHTGRKMFEQVHANYLDWVRQLTECQQQYDAELHVAEDSYRSLRRLPFNRSDTIEATQKRLADEIQTVEALIANASEQNNNIDSLLDEILAPGELVVQTTYVKMNDLRQEHGEFVPNSAVAEAAKLKDSYAGLRQSALQRIQEERQTCKLDLDKLQKEREIVLEIFELLKSDNNDIDDERYVQTCEDGLTRVQNLYNARIALDKSINALQMRLGEIKADASDIGGKIAKSLKQVQENLPVWETEGNNIAKELAQFRQEVQRLRTNVVSIQRDCLNYRDKVGTGNLNDLTTRCELLLERLQKCDDACEYAGKKCSNGNDLSSLRKQCVLAKGLLSESNGLVVALAQDINGMLKSGALVQIQYVPYTLSFASQLERSIRHFEFAIYFPQAGKHHVEIQFYTGKYSVYKHREKHDVVLNYAVSGVQKKSGSFRFEDSTISWNDGIKFEGDFREGYNNFILDLIFRAEDKQGKLLKDGAWQYQFNGSRWKGLQENFWIDFLVDGVKQKVYVVQYPEEK